MLILRGGSIPGPEGVGNDVGLAAMSVFDYDDDDDEMSKEANVVIYLADCGCAPITLSRHFELIEGPNGLPFTILPLQMSLVWLHLNANK
ncbi:hypothetical protein BLOT_013334 [Blomia tropicalis]|nr:hypothetical protein BLOT_013334 [Blomia tropicalis]